jgi:hypothetical protein
VAWSSPPFQAQFERTKLRSRRFSRGFCFWNNSWARRPSSSSRIPSSNGDIRGGRRSRGRRMAGDVCRVGERRHPTGSNALGMWSGYRFDARSSNVLGSILRGAHVSPLLERLAAEYAGLGSPRGPQYYLECAALDEPGAVFQVGHGRKLRIDRAMAARCFIQRRWCRPSRRWTSWSVVIVVTAPVVPSATGDPMQPPA